MIKVSCDDFKVMINKALPFIASRTTMPILKNFLFYTRDGKLHIESTDLNCYFKSWCPCDTKEEYQFCVQADTLVRSTATSKTDEVLISLESDNTVVFCFGPKQKCKLQTADSLTYPKSTDVVMDRFVSVDAEELIDALRIVRTFALKKEASEFDITGINIKSKGDTISITGTDTKGSSTCLVQTKFQPKEEFDVIVPLKNINVIIKSISERDECVDMSFFGNSVGLHTSQSDIISGTLAGKFPPVEKAYDYHIKSLDKKVIVDSENLINSLNFARNSVTEETTRMIFEISTGSIKMFSQSDTGLNESYMDWDYQGDSMTIMFDPRYMYSFLSSIRGDIEFLFCNPEKPILMKSQDGDKMCFIVPMYTK